MQDHPKGGEDDPAFVTNDVEDDRLQVAVLRLVLYPATLTMDELIREMTGGGSRDFGEIDAIQRAVRELAGSGLLHRPGEEGEGPADALGPPLLRLDPGCVLTRHSPGPSWQGSSPRSEPGTGGGRREGLFW